MEAKGIFLIILGFAVWIGIAQVLGWKITLALYFVAMLVLPNAWEAAKK